MAQKKLEIFSVFCTFSFFVFLVFSQKHWKFLDFEALVLDVWWSQKFSRCISGISKATQINAVNISQFGDKKLKSINFVKFKGRCVMVSRPHARSF